MYGKKSTVCGQNVVTVRECNQHSVINAFDVNYQSIHFKIVTRRTAINKRCQIHFLHTIIVSSRKKVEIIIVSC